ncbi:SSU ribosomal protein S9p (S16e) [Streptococcus mitis]|uniref:SSU ribosomal protein S9p (S16e) n=1 Tax=Streptococcus mitis TaxID=28037 RepID=A0A150NY02_STRMT|nr:SSU ribosomal protein S9p (S16e) [Streptococcus mitis]KYF38355.1 SSU ribosomal protein S9p (S16e) [Streptococcus mitis]
MELSTLTLHNNQKFLTFQDLSKERNNKVCHKHNMQVLDVVKTLLHAFALFQELVKSLLTKKMLKSTSHTLTFVL